MQSVNSTKTYIRQSWARIDTMGLSNRYLLLQQVQWLLSQGFTTIVSKSGKVTFAPVTPDHL